MSPKASKASHLHICQHSLVVNVADRQSHGERSIPCGAKNFRQMDAKMNIFYTLLIQNIENGKLHRQVDSVDAGLNRDSQ